MGVVDSVPCREFIVQITQFKAPSYTKEMASGLSWERPNTFRGMAEFCPRDTWLSAIFNWEWHSTGRIQLLDGRDDWELASKSGIGMPQKLSVSCWPIPTLTRHAFWPTWCTGPSGPYDKWPGSFSETCIMKLVLGWINTTFLSTNLDKHYAIAPFCLIFVLVLVSFVNISKLYFRSWKLPIFSLCF